MNATIFLLTQCMRRPLIRSAFQFKGTNCPPKDMWDLTCLLQLLIRLPVSDYANVDAILEEVPETKTIV